MSKFITLAIGAAEITAGAILMATGVGAPLGAYLVGAGIGTTIGSLGTLLSKGPVHGFATTERNPTAPWNIVYGRARVGGTVVYINMWPGPGQGAGGSDQMLDMVIVLAAHPCQSVDVVLFDQQRVQIDPTNSAPPGAAYGAGTSFTPKQQYNLNISNIKRNNGVVTVTLTDNIPLLIDGDRIQISQDSGMDLASQNLIGIFTVAQILVQMTGSLIFTYLSGGTNCSISGHGVVNTVWADYGRKVYFEPLLGSQTLGETFQGMIQGTPLDGDMGDFVRPEHTGGVEGADRPNPWTADCSLQGKTAVFLRLHYSDQYFHAGLPQISFLMHGKKDIYDPRTSTRGYSENAALCIADFLADTTWGFKAAMSTDIPYANLIAAANVCDEQVPLASSLTSPPATEPAYTCNGQFTLEMKRGEILQNLLTSCAGRLTYVNGQFVIWPASWTGVSFAIGSNPGGGIIPLPDFYDIAAGPIRWKPTTSIRELYNGVKGTYISQANKWMPTDFPPYAQDSMHGYAGPTLYQGDVNLAWDGGDRRWKDIQLPFTISASTAQRIAKIELLRTRYSGGNARGTGTFTFNMTAYQIAPLDLLEVTLPYLSWSGKTLEVTRMQLRLEDGAGINKAGPALLVEMDVQEIEPSIYDWFTTEELSPQGYVQPVIPGVGIWEFFATELVPGYTVPFPWTPAYVHALVGDALWPTPQYGSTNHGHSSYGIQVAYGQDAQGNAVAELIIKGAIPANQLATSITTPQITCTVGTSGTLPPGKYIIAVSCLSTDATPKDTLLSTPVPVTIPAGPSNGSIAVTIDWPFGGNGGMLYMAAGSNKTGWYRQGTLSSSTTSFSIGNFDRNGIGAPDPTFDHLAIAWKKLVHGGPWAQQVQAVTHNTITIAGPGMTTNMWAGRVLSLLGKLDSTQDIIILNMPVASSTASGSPPFFTLTIGPNSNGDQLPDLTTLLSIGDLVLMRFHGTFTADSMYDPLTANPYYPAGATGIEAGHLAMVLTGPNAGDVQTIASMALDSFGNETIMLLANPWTIQPNTGDIVIVVEGDFGPEVHTQSYKVASNSASISGPLVSPLIQNLINQSWLFIARTQDSEDVNGDDAYAPIREVYFFGSQIPRSITGNTTQLLSDGVINADATAGDLTVQCLPFATVFNVTLAICKVDASANTVTVMAATGDYFGVPGVTSVVLDTRGQTYFIKFSG